MSNERIAIIEAVESITIAKFSKETYTVTNDDVVEFIRELYHALATEVDTHRRVQLVKQTTDDEGVSGDIPDDSSVSDYATGPAHPFNIGVRELIMKELDKSKDPVTRVIITPEETIVTRYHETKQKVATSVGSVK